MARTDHPPVPIVIVDRGQLAEKLATVAARCEAEISVRSCASVLDVLGENGPKTAGGLLCSVNAAGPFLSDLLGWTEPEGRGTIPACVVGAAEEAAAIDLLLGHDQVRWADAERLEETLADWLKTTVEVQDLRHFRGQHEGIAQQVREARMRLFSGEIESFVPPEGPPCGPPLPTSIEEISSLKEARAQFERGLIRAAVREAGSLKDASAALGISYTSLWRRMR